MATLVDTTILIDHLRGYRPAEVLLLDLFGQRERVWAAVLSRTEVIAGIRAHERSRMNELFSILAWVDVDPAIADAAGEMALRHSATHPGVDISDYVIAASAQAIGAQLVTSNVRHFPMFPDLRPPY